MKHLRPIIALLSLSALTGGAVQAERADAVDTEALRVDYQAVQQYSFSANSAVTEYVLGSDGSGAPGTSPASSFYLPPLLKDFTLASPTSGDSTFPLYLLYGVLLFYDHITGFA